MPVVRYWASLDGGQQSLLKVVLPILCGVPGMIILFRRHKARKAGQPAK